MGTDLFSGTVQKQERGTEEKMLLRGWGLGESTEHSSPANTPHSSLKLSLHDTLFPACSRQQAVVWKTVWQRSAPCPFQSHVQVYDGRVEQVVALLKSHPNVIYARTKVGVGGGTASSKPCCAATAAATADGGDGGGS